MSRNLTVLFSVIVLTIGFNLPTAFSTVQPEAVNKKFVKKTARKIAKNQIAKKEPKLNVNSAKTADSATNADALGGVEPSRYVRGYFAAVDYSSNGTSIISGSDGVTALSEEGEGFPKLQFPVPMDDCAIVATTTALVGDRTIRRSVNFSSGTTVGFRISNASNTTLRDDFSVVAVC